jgi:hypothetical protein
MDGNNTNIAKLLTAMRNLMIALMGLAVATGLVACGSQKEQKPPNIVFIFPDQYQLKKGLSELLRNTCDEWFQEKTCSYFLTYQDQSF